MRPGGRRPKPPDEVAFPVTPMLDMAFQLMAFFVLTFQTPSRETRIDLVLPAAPAALAPAPAAGPRVTTGADDALETDLVVRAESDARGSLKALRLGSTPLPGADALGDRLRQYVKLLAPRPVRISVVADDRLLYEEAARLIAACTAAEVAAVRLSQPPPESRP